MEWMYLAGAGLLAEVVFIFFEYSKKPAFALAFKTAASLLFVSLGVWVLPKSADPIFAKIVLAGLIFGAAGDVLLNLRTLAGNAGEKIFISGIGAFFLGHLLYIAALAGREIKALLFAVPVCVLLSLTVLPWMLKRIEVKGKLRIFGIVYIGLVFLMAGCSAGLLVLENFSFGHLLFAIGAALFAASDVILVFYLFGKKKHMSFRALNLSAYYVAQILIAFCMMLV